MNTVPNEETPLRIKQQPRESSQLQRDEPKVIVNNARVVAEQKKEKKEEEDNSILEPTENLKGFYEISKNLKAKALLHCENVHEGNIGSLIVTADNRYIIVVSRFCDNLIKVLDFETGYERFHYIHKDSIRSAVVTLDNKYVISGSFDGSIRSFNLELREEVPQQDWSQSGIVASDKRLMVCVHSVKGSLRVLDLQTGQEVPHIQNPHRRREVFRNQSDVCSVALTSDNKFLLSGLNDGSIKLFDFDSGEKVYHFKNIHQNKINSLTVTSDNKFLISAAYSEKSIKIIDLNSRKEVYHFQNVHQDAIHSVLVTPDYKYVISTSNKSMKILDLHVGEEVHHFKNVHKYEITSLTMAFGSRFLLSGSADGSIKIFDLNTKEEVHHLHPVDKDNTSNGSHAITSMTVTADNSYIICASRDRSLKIFGFRKTRMTRGRQNVPHFDASPTNIIVTADNKWMIFASREKYINIVDLHTREEVYRFATTHQHHITSLAVSSDKKYIISASHQAIKIFDLNTKMEIPIPDVENVHGEKIYSLDVTYDNKYIISASDDRSVVVWDFSTKKVFRCIEEAPKMIMTADNRYIISSCDNVLDENHYERSIKVFDWRANKQVLHFENIHESNISLMTVTPENQSLICGFEDGSIQILDLILGEKVYLFEKAHQYSIGFLIVTSNNKLLLSADEKENSIKVFDLHTKQQVHHFENIYKNEISSMIVTPCNKFLISAVERERSIKVFDLHTKLQVHSFDNPDEDSIYSMTMTSDNKFIVSSTRGLKIFDFNLKQEKFDLKERAQSSTEKLYFSKKDSTIYRQELYFIYKGINRFVAFNSADDFLFNKPIEETVSRAQKMSELFVFPFRWTILHIVSIYANHTFIENMPEYSQFKMPFLLDAFNNTPFYYLISQKKVNLITANIMFRYLCDYLEDCSLKSPFEFQRIIESLSSSLLFILKKIEMKTRHRFLRIIYTKSPVPHSNPAPLFGKSLLNDAFFCDSPVLTQKTREKIWSDQGTAQIKFCSNFLYLDYDVLSQDMDKIMDCLKNQEDEDFFKIASIRRLIDHLWGQAKTALNITYSVYLAFIVALCVYLTFEDRSFAYEMTLLILSVFFIANEVFQFSHLEEIYLKDPWSWIDLIHLQLTIVFLMTRFADDDNELTRAWISSIIIILGCLRCISLLRIFEPTRNLIQAIITSTIDILSFVIIIAFIIIGISLVFFMFDIETKYGDCFYKAYNVLYGSTDLEEDMEDRKGTDWVISQKVLMSVLAFFLNVVLLNLLIAIMYKSYDNILDMRKRTDSLTRLKIISKAVIYKKLFRPKHQTKRGYLVYCLPEEFEEDEGDEKHKLENNITTLKKIMWMMNDKILSFEESNKTMKLSLKASHEAIKDETSVVKNEISTVKDEVLTAKNEISTVKNDISAMKNEMGNLTKIILSGFSSLKRDGNHPAGGFSERQVDMNSSPILKRNLLEDIPEPEDSQISQHEEINS